MRPLSQRHQGPGVGRLGKHLVAQDQRRFDVLNDLQVVQRPEDLLFVPAQGGLEIAGTDNDLLGVLPLVAGAARVASVLLQQLPLGLTEAVALPLSGRGMARDPPGDRTGILAGLVGRDDAVQLLQAPQSGEVDQAMPRGMGGDQRAVQGATTGGGQALRHGPFQDLTMKGLQQWSDPVAEGIPAAARGRDPQSPATEGSDDRTCLSPIGQANDGRFGSRTRRS